MKKTVTLPDGTVEVLEGTPEEIAAHEKLIREKASRNPKKPDVLKGSEPTESEQAAKWQELIDALKKLEQPYQPYWPNQLIWVAPCSRCHTSPCVCQHIYYKTTTSDNVEVQRPREMPVPGDGAPRGWY